MKILNNRIAGITLDLLLLILAKLKSLFGFSNREAVIVSIHKLGDTVFTLPAIKKVISSNKYEKITIITNGSGKYIYTKYLQNLNFVIVERKDFAFGERIVKPAYWPALMKLQAGTVLDFSGGVHSAFISALIFSKVLVGINEERFRQLYTLFIPIRNLPHIIDIYGDIVKYSIKVELTDTEKTFACVAPSINRILIAPKGGWAAKEWGLHRFIAVVVLLKQDFEVSVIFESGTLENDIKESFRFEGINFIETSTMEELFTAIENTDLFFSNDTGPLYVANLAGKATFAIYGPTNPKFHLPLGKGHGFSQKNLLCSPVKEKYCYTLGGRYCTHHSCMSELTVPMVYQELREFITTFNMNLAVHE